MSSGGRDMDETGAAKDPSLSDELTIKEMDIIQSLDSRSFGFLDINDNGNKNTTSSSSSLGTNFVSRDFLKRGIKRLCRELSNDSCSDRMKASSLCQIGHLHLLLEEYSESLSAYQNYSILSSESNLNSSFLYGVGLIYFAFQKYDWAIEAFRKVLALSPDFARLSEIHVRLGIILKEKGQLTSSLEHFVRSLTSTGPCSMSKLEIQFHIGHIHDINGNKSEAKQAFEWILASKNVPNDIKALALRQLGWLYHTHPQIATQTENPHSKATELLKLAVGANPSSGQAWYFLARCHADQGQFKEAFLAYRQSVNCMENQPDTWCGIGIIYQQMGQARDSLQAYITAIYFCLSHYATWTDLGLLYESCGQLVDALLCYKNGLIGAQEKGPASNVYNVLVSRVNYVEQLIHQAGGVNVYSQQCSKTLPTLYEAWYSLIPQHLKVKYPVNTTPILQLPPATLPSMFPSSAPRTSANITYRKQKMTRSKSKDPIILKSFTDGYTPPVPTSPFSSLFTAPSPDTPYPGHESDPFDHLNFTNSTKLMPTQDPYTFPTNGNNPILYYPDTNPQTTYDSGSGLFTPDPTFCSPPTFSTVAPGNESVNSISARSPLDYGSLSSIPPSLGNVASPMMGGACNVTSVPNNPLLPLDMHPNIVPPTPYPSQDIPFNPPPVDFSQLPFAPPPGPRDYTGLNPIPDGDQSVLAEIEGVMQGVTSVKNDVFHPQVEENPSRWAGQKRLHSSQEKGHKLVALSPTCLQPDRHEAAILHVSTEQNDLEAITSNITPLSSAASTKSATPTMAETLSSLTHSSSEVMDVAEPMQTSSHSGGGTGMEHMSDSTTGSYTKMSTSSDRSSSSSHPSSPLSNPSPNKKRCLEEDVRDNRLMPICEPHRGLGRKEEYMRQDPFLPPSPEPPKEIPDLHPKLPMYTVKSYEDAMSNELHEFCTNPDHPICVIRGVVEAVGFDLNLFSSMMLMKVSGSHEVEVREQIHQEAEDNWDPTGKKQIWKCESSKSVTTVKEYGEYQQQMLADERRNAPNRVASRKMIKFGTNCDLSDQNKWRRQLKEIKKLPKYLQVDCPEANLLNHVGHTVLGMNTVQLYMKVSGSRTPGHQENNNFCSLNINIGPGDCEWFGVSNKYWGIMHQMCERHKVSFLVGSWWPILKELEEYQVPVYRFTQYKGDVVWINPGCVHWVQANSCCNNIAWNVGPMTAHQFRMAWERYQWNKVMKVRSIVPMMSLTWNLARRVKIADSNLFKQISSLLHSSYNQCSQLLSQLNKAEIPILWHGHVDGEHSPACAQCLDEVFNILFVLKSKKGEHLVYCHKCVQQLQLRNRKVTFTVLQQYSMDELRDSLCRFKTQPLAVQ